MQLLYVQPNCPYLVCSTVLVVETDAVRTVFIFVVSAVLLVSGSGGCLLWCEARILTEDI